MHADPHSAPSSVCAELSESAHRTERFVRLSQKPVLTSLLLVEERLLEAHYFAQTLRRALPHQLPYHLNAFLSAARAVTWMLQKEMSEVPGFEEWYAARQAEMGNDKAARFFLLQRNFSQKEGRVRTSGYRGPKPRSGWSYRFIDGRHKVPADLVGRDLAECCAEHPAKLARLILQFADDFPYHSCPQRALTVEGVEALGLNLRDVFISTGLPGNVFDAAPNDKEVQLGGMRTLVDAVDFKAIEKLTKTKKRRMPTSIDAHLKHALMVADGSHGSRAAIIAAALLITRKGH